CSCLAKLSKWSACGSATSSGSVWVAMSLDLRQVEVVRAALHLGLDDEVVLRGRGGGEPLVAARAPWVALGALTMEQRDQEVDQREQQADAENAGASGREHVEPLVLLRVAVVATRHARVAEEELGHEREEEPREDRDGRDHAPAL